MAGERSGPGPNWEGLLKWSIANSDGLQQNPVSEEDRKWFNEAMQSNTVDVIRRMKEISVVMNTPQQVLNEQGVTYEEVEGMLEELQEHVESIDMANDLHAIGGLVPLLNYLRHPRAGVRARAAEVVSTIVQNNSKSQQQVMDVRGLQLLLHNFTSDEDLNVRAKALGAISSLIRHNKAGVVAFRLASNGYSGLRDALPSNNRRLQRKALQVILYLLEENSKDSKVLWDLGFPRVLLPLVSNPDMDIRQEALRILVQLRQNDVILEPQGGEPKGHLNQILSERIQEVLQPGAGDLVATDERYLLDTLWQMSFDEPSTIRQNGLLVPGTEAEEQEYAGTDVPSSAGPPVHDRTGDTGKSDKKPMMLLGPG